jgi:hypothetical protein
VVGQIDEAINIFDRVNPKSERYSMAMVLAGQNYWRRYLTEKAKPENEQNKDQMSTDRQKAVERLLASLKTDDSSSGTGHFSSKYQIEAQLTLGDASLEENKMNEAVGLYQPIIDSVMLEKPKSLDGTTVRAFVGAIRAYAALNNFEKTQQVGKVLLDLGPDTPQVNTMLVEFAKLLNAERKKADARVPSWATVPICPKWKLPRKNLEISKNCSQQH